MFRSTVIKSIQDYLANQETGEIIILRSEDDETLDPPYAVVRVGSADDIGNGQYDIWDLNVLVAISHDCESISIEAAEAAAAAVFELLADPEEVAAGLAPEVVVSSWMRLGVEAQLLDQKWQHIAGFRLIAAPAA